MHQFPDVTDLSAVELLGECFMPRLDVESFVTDDVYRSRILQLVRKHKAGGFCVFGETPESVAQAVTALQEEAKMARKGTTLAGIPLFFSCDCEFGLRMRLKRGGTEFPDAMAMAKAGDPELVRQVGAAIAKEMRTLGLHWNFAPVTDVNSNPKNPIINTRSFGDNPETVIQYSVPFMEGLQSEGIAGCAKHFPGHGDTAVDSHHELPFIEGGWDRFGKGELPPFEALISAGVASVMTGHLACPEFARELGATEEESRLPATLSKTLSMSLLCGQLGFTGVIVTDAMEMHAITKLFGDGEAAVRALVAGADVLLMPVEPERTFEALLDAVDTSRLSIDVLQEKVSRIWEMRKSAGLLNEAQTPDLTALARLEKEHLPLSSEIARRAIRLSGDINVQDATLLIIADDRPQATDKASYFASQAAVLFRDVRTVTVQEWQSALVTIDDTTVIATFHRARGYLGGAATDWSLPRIMASIAEGKEAALDGRTRARRAMPRGLVLIGSPYLDAGFEDATQFVLKTFSESFPSIDAALERLQQTA